MASTVAAVLFGLSLAGPAAADPPGDPPAAEAPSADPRAAEAVVPEGFIAMEVVGVFPTSAGHAVFLGDPQGGRLVPIWVGGTEALAIELRLERRRFERPLTHDLLDQAIRELGGEVTGVRIDALRAGVFVATITLEEKDRSIRLDARASDSIALALANQVPILVSTAVVDEAGISSLDMQLPTVGEPPARDEPL